MNVIPIYAENVILDKNCIVMHEGESIGLNAKVVPDNATYHDI